MPPLSRSHGGQAAPSPEMVREELDRILASPVFNRSARLTSFLRYIVEHALSGDASTLKEQVIAIELYNRNGDFDATLDPIVRVDARRLRDKLREYYTEYPNQPIVISFPKGTYAPVIEARHTGIDVEVIGTDVTPADGKPHALNALNKNCFVSNGPRRPS